MNYELMLILKTGESSTLASRVEKIIKDAGAVNLKTNNLGKKILAYRIEGQADADYFLYNFDGQGEIIKKINDKLRLEQEGVLRYLITRVEIKKFKSRKRLGKAEEEIKVEKQTPKVTVKTVKAKGRTNAPIKPKTTKTEKTKVTKVKKEKK